MIDNQARLHFLEEETAARKIAGRLENHPAFEGFPVAAFETDEPNRIWTVSVYVPSREAPGIAKEMETFLAEIGYPVGFDVEMLDDTDWVAHSLRGLAPVRAGRFTIVGSHDAKGHRHSDRTIVVDAGQAFGTGHHGTTVACLEMLGMCLRQRAYRNILDLGTGTGVLAIAAARMTQARLLATDLDPVSVSIARQNARANRAHARIRSFAAAGFADRRFAEYGPFDLIVANILAGPLAHMARDLTRNLSDRATIILSGLLPHQRARIVAAYRHHGMILRHTHFRDGWLALVFDNYRDERPLALADGPTAGPGSR